MGYSHIRISENASNLCMINIPRAKHHYKHLPMVFANSSDIFQHKMNYLFHGFDFIHAYIDEILVLTKRSWTYHVQKLESTINKLK